MDDLEYLKKLAGINEFTGYTEYSPTSLAERSKAAAELKALEKEHSFVPGTPEWFDLWFRHTNNLNQVPSFRGRKK